MLVFGDWWTGKLASGRLVTGTITNHQSPDMFNSELSSRHETSSVPDCKSKFIRRQKMRSGEEMLCSFCNKNKNEVRKLIAGPNDVFVCDACVELCNDILADELADEKKITPEEQPPKDLYPLSDLHQEYSKEVAMLEKEKSEFEESLSTLEGQLTALTPTVEESTDNLPPDGYDEFIIKPLKEEYATAQDHINTVQSRIESYRFAIGRLQTPAAEETKKLMRRLKDVRDKNCTMLLLPEK